MEIIPGSSRTRFRIVLKLSSRNRCSPSSRNPVRVHPECCSESSRNRVHVPPDSLLWSVRKRIMPGAMAKCLLRRYGEAGDSLRLIAAGNLVGSEGAGRCLEITTAAQKLYLPTVCTTYIPTRKNAKNGLAALSAWLRRRFG
jgi:hypothetical protein